MYIEKDFLKLTTDELTDYTAKGFALCYIDTCERLDLRDDFGDKCKPVYAGATPLDVLERIGKWMVPCPEVNWEEDKYY